MLNLKLDTKQDTLKQKMLETKPGVFISSYNIFENIQVEQGCKYIEDNFDPKKSNFDLFE